MTQTSSPDRIPVTVLTGFLGAGKTTLLNRLLAEDAFRDTAVIVNEFGAVGLDADMVETADARAFAMTTGCLCCTVAGDVRLTLLRLADDAASGRGPRFRRLVIETTGLADPAPVLHSLMSSEPVRDRYVLNGVVTVVDAVLGDTTLTRFEEARRQAAVADLVILSKTDLADPAPLAARLGALNPNATLRRAEAIGPQDVFGLAAFDPALKPPEVARWLHYAAHAHGHAHGGTAEDGIGSWCFTGDTPLDAWDIQDAIEALQDRLGGHLLRLKAIVQLEEDPDRPVLLHAVQHVLHPPARLAAWSGKPVSRLVVIAAGPERHAVPGLVAHHLPALQAYAGDVEVAAP